MKSDNGVERAKPKFESLHSGVRHIDPKTGLEIAPKEVDKKLVVYHWLKSRVRSTGFLGIIQRKIEDQGIASLSKSEINQAHKIIKRIAGGQK